MKLIEDTFEHAPLVKNSLKKYGFNVEHNYEHFKCCDSKTNKNIFVNFSRGKGILGSIEYGHTWHLFPQAILAPKKDRFDMFTKFLSLALFKHKAKKVVVEVDEPMRKEIVARFEHSKKFKPLTLNYILYWPVFNMKLFDHQLKGKAWKKMRNICNRFKKQYRVRMVDSKTVPKDKLKRVIDLWLRRRMHTDTVDEEYYYNIVDNEFKGFDIAKTLLVNGEPCSITAGWKVPNHRGHYYSGIGIVNHKHSGLGEYVNMRDLLFLKKKGFKVVDFGGSDYCLLNFKNKFKPHFMYKTYVFSIVRR